MWVDIGATIVNQPTIVQVTPEQGGLYPLSEAIIWFNLYLDSGAVSNVCASTESPANTKTPNPKNNLRDL